MDPLELLPPELWRLIFEKVEEPQDWLNLYRASPTFEGVVVGDKRPTALLAQVLPHVYQHVAEDLGGVLPLRLVSRQWKEVVDAILDSTEGDAVFQNDDMWETYHFEDSARIYSFMDMFGTNPGNPFIGSVVVVSFDPENKTEEMMAEYEIMVFRLLDKFGMHIKEMNLDWTDANLLDKVLRQFRSCVELTPNLELLSVKFEHPQAYDVLNYRDANPVPENQRLPLLSKLKGFYFESDLTSKELRNLQNMIIRMCCNPDTLTTAKIVGIPPALATFQTLEIASLEIIIQESYQSNLANYSCPLSSLTLLKKSGFIDLGSVLTIAEHFKDTLTDLRIDCCLSTATEDSHLRLDLPHLKYLVIPWLYDVSPFSLLENLSNLEELHICQPDYHLFSPNFLVWKWFTDFVEVEMTQSRIWELLPKLKKVKLMGEEGEEALYKKPVLIKGKTIIDYFVT